MNLSINCGDVNETLTFMNIIVNKRVTSPSKDKYSFFTLFLYRTIIFAPVFNFINLYMSVISVYPIDNPVISNSYPA